MEELNRELRERPERHERGQLIWHTSEEGGGPDVGLELGLGGGFTLYAGEVADRTLAEAGIDLAEHKGGWWVALICGDEYRPVGPVANEEAARELVDQVFAALQSAEARAQEAEQERDELQKALTGLTCGGSEFFVRKGDRFAADIDACVAWVRRSKEDAHRRSLEAIKARQSAEARAQAAEARVGELTWKIEIAHHLCQGPAPRASHG